MGETTNARNQVNVRLDDATFAVVNELAANNRMTKSQVVRAAIAGQLEAINGSAKNSLSDDERAELLEVLTKTMTNLSAINAIMAREGNNINQIAKAANTGRITRHPDTDNLVARREEMSKYLSHNAERLNKIWQSLV